MREPTTSELLELDLIVSKALGRRVAVESIADAAERIMRSPEPNAAWPVAREILTARHGEAWKKLARAARIAKRLRAGGRLEFPS